MTTPPNSPRPILQWPLSALLPVLIVAWFAFCTIATATTVVTVDADRLIRDASLITHVRCRECISYRNDDGLIATRYQFDVIDTLKGTPVATLECVQPGGRIGNIVTIVPGLTTYRPQQELVLFLSPKSPNSDYRLPVGLDQGVYRVEMDHQSGAQVARRDLSGLHRLPATTGESLEEGLPVAEFKADVRDRVRRQREQPTGGER